MALARARCSSFVGVLVLGLAGCQTGAYARAKHADTEDAWRAFLADHPDGAEAESARDQLDEALWRDVDQVHTPLGYRRYLDELPDGAHAETARERLRALHHQQPGDSGRLDLDATAEASPDAARAALDASAGGDPAALRAFLARYPKSARDAELREREDDLSFALAARADAQALRRFLELHPHTRHRDEVEVLLGAREVKALLWEERFVDADVRLHGLGDGALQGQLARELCARQARWARARTSALADLGSEGLALVLADEGAVTSMARGLASEDAAEGIAVIWALAETGAPSALDPLLHALDPERSLAVRWSARVALAALVRAWPVEVRELELGQRLAQVSARAASAPLWFEEAVLEDALALVDSAATLAKARHDAPDDPLLLAEALRRGDLREPERGLTGQQLRALLPAIPEGEGCARAWFGSLLQRRRPAAGACGDAPHAPPSGAEARRLDALAALSKRMGSAPALRAQLGRLAERDGSERVRAAALAALGGAPTLDLEGCP